MFVHATGMLIYPTEKFSLQDGEANWQNVGQTPSAPILGLGVRPRPLTVVTQYVRSQLGSQPILEK